MKRIVWEFGDGSTQYTPVDPLVRERTGETEDEHIACLVATRAPRLSPVRLDLTVRTEEERLSYEASLGDGVRARFVGIISAEEYEAKPREFREAWEIGGVNMPKAREMKRHSFRRKRAPLLEALDIAYQLADERGDTAEKQRIAAEKQALRDVPAHPGIEAAKTPKELMDVFPEVLK